MRLFEVASTVVAWLGEAVAVVARRLVQVVFAVGLGVVANDVWHIAPRTANWLVRWWSRCRYGDTERARVRVEEVTGQIDKLPGSMLKLVTAAGFAASALPAGAVRLAHEAVSKLVSRARGSRSGLGTVVAALQRAEIGHATVSRSTPVTGVGPATPASIGTVLTTVARRAATASGVVMCPLGLVALAVASVNAGADIGLAYESGDRPVDSAPALCVKTCTRPPPEDSWALDAGSSITTTYTSEEARDVDTLAGRLSVSGRCDARIAWTISVDGQELAQGTLDAGRDIDLTRFDVPTNRTPASLSLAARRVDRGDCTANLSWLWPGYEAPGFLPPIL